jgi:hypothetical protein
VVFLGLVLVVCATANPTATSTLRVRIVIEKEKYAVNETVIVRGELTNLSKQTLCFPKPAQECATSSSGSLITTGEPEQPSDDTEIFICRMCGGGKQGHELESAIKNDWIKLAPGETYTTSPAQAQVKLVGSGKWRLRATYEPPQGSFSPKYRELLQSAAQKAGCTLPESIVTAEPKLITVNNDER